jgi:hypothetical protein
MKKLQSGIESKKSESLGLGIKEDVNNLLQSSQALEIVINNAARDLEVYESTQTKLKTLIEQRNKILDEVETNLEDFKVQIGSKFKAFCESRKDSSAEEKTLFEKIIQGIEIDGDLIFDEAQFSKDVLDKFVDRRTIKNQNDLRVTISEPNTDGSSKPITLAALKTWMTTGVSSANCFNRDGADGILEYVFTSWPKFLRVRATVKLNGKPTAVLSIGQRGTLLLKVFLATATAKQIFIIDQPEDNLDNSFIMQELVPLLRQAKKNRQIIMSTHNANLVVNADAEQIIVAQLDGSGNYISGSIENPNINRAIRDILEGGEDAFRQRERKYQVL